jgi:hypothetical protein
MARGISTEQLLTRGMSSDQLLMSSQLGGSQLGQSSTPHNYDAAVSSYGAQLQAWVHLQVDRRVSQVIGTFVDGDLSNVRHESATALSLAERLEGDVCAVTEAQAKLLNVVQRHEAGISDLRQFELVLQAREEQLEARFLSQRTELLAQMSEMISSAGLARKEDEWRLEELHNRVSGSSSLREELNAVSMELRTAASSSKAELEVRIGEMRLELRGQIEEHQSSFRSELLELQQRLLGILRMEMTQAFRNEAAAVTAFDQQLKQRMEGMASMTTLRDRSVFDRAHTAHVPTSGGQPAVSPTLHRTDSSEVTANAVHVTERVEGEKFEEEALAQLNTALGAPHAELGFSYHQHLSLPSLPSPQQPQKPQLYHQHQQFQTHPFAPNGNMSSAMLDVMSNAAESNGAHGKGVYSGGALMSFSQDFSSSGMLAEDAIRAREELQWLASKKI